MYAFAFCVVLIELQSAVDVLIFSIGLTYAVMSPFILPFIVLFFAIAYVVGRYMVVSLFHEGLSGL